jgi:ankyrin repeat protein
MLLAAGADVNESTEEDGSALIIAISSGHEEFAKFLLESGADPNAKDPYGITALHYAMHDALLTISGARKVRPTDRLGWLRPNMPDVVKLLLQRGADPNAKITSQFLFLDYLPVARHIGGGLPQMDLVGVTPLMLAAAAGDTTLMRILLEAGASSRVATHEGVTPLMLAAGFATERGRRNEKDAIEATKLALQLGGDVNAKKDDGRTALHVAVVLGWSEMIRLLVENGADLEATDMYRQTPMTIALGDPEGFLFRQLAGGREDDRFRKTGAQPKIVELLLNLGASPWTGKRRDRSAQ